MTEIAVIGGGSWGTALALLLARNGKSVSLWVHDPALADLLQRGRENTTYLPGFLLPDSIRISNSLCSVLEGAELGVLAVPSHAVRSLAIPSALPLVSATKGIEPETLLRISQILENRKLAVLSGPTFAREVAAARPAAVVAASSDAAFALAVQQTFANSEFRVYTSSDVTGVELGGAFKNVIAIGAGICTGLGLGHNALAALITRGLAEITRLGLAMGAAPSTLSGLAGLGDLVLTCTGELSRNRKLGFELALGMPLSEILAGTRFIAEGVRTAHAVVELGIRYAVDLPIAQQMNAVLNSNVAPSIAIRALMDRALRDE